MGQALYRKYRQTSLAGMVGQEHITDSLATAIKSGRISHAYLLTGPRGVGKTSVARILAHEINGLPYAENQAYLDIIEIDAASNNGVEDVRDLREKVYVAPAQAKYKVYIIDEVHMLSKAAFNALLKTLEEPPAHVVFILATTESHKLPDTIISRTQRFVFRPIDVAKAIAHLRTIADAEKITISDDALALVAAHGDGSFRDSIGLLDQLAGSEQNIEASDVEAMLGMPSSAVITELATSLQSGSVAMVMGQLNNLYDRGFQAASVARELASLFRNQLLEGKALLSLAVIQKLLVGLLEVPASRDPERYLEIVLLANLEPATAGVTVTVAPKVVAVTKPKPEPATSVAPTKPTTARATSKLDESSTTEPKEKPAAEVLIEKPKPAAVSEPDDAPVETPVPVEAGASLDDAVWQQLLSSLKKQYNTLYSIVRMAKPTLLADDQLELRFAFAFHQKRLGEAKNRQIVADALKQASGRDMDIICVFDPDLKLAHGGTANNSPASAPAPSVDPALSTISNIFGGGELLES